MILFFRAMAPTMLWDWAMRKLGYLSPKTLDLNYANTTTVAKAPVKPEVRAAAN